ncbi:hypothetical protein BD413DRAFT_226973 [Trametes elegans]|nr:hypothetical protein BD413DRAFT_226973 [Trametes elegans]
MRAQRASNLCLSSGPAMTSMIVIGCRAPYCIPHTWPRARAVDHGCLSDLAWKMSLHLCCPSRSRPPRHPNHPLDRSATSHRCWFCPMMTCLLGVDLPGLTTHLCLIGESLESCVRRPCWMRRSPNIPDSSAIGGPDRERARSLRALPRELDRPVASICSLADPSPSLNGRRRAG